MSLARIRSSFLVYILCNYTLCIPPETYYPQKQTTLFVILRFLLASSGGLLD